MSNYILYGAEFSLYSGKARAYLNYKGVPYEEVLSTKSVYEKIIVPKTGVKFIPVVKTPDEQYLQDTTNIIDQLEVKFPEKSVYPTGNKQRLVSLLLELYGDEWLLIPAMHYRWNFKENFPFIFSEFGKILNPKLPKFIRAMVGKKIGRRFKNVVPMLGITSKTIPAFEHWFEQQFLPDLDKHFSKYQFLLGDIPSIGDFGFFGPLYAHLSRDPYPGKLIADIAPNVADWVERMKNASSVEGDFLADDEIPETLFPILKHLFEAQWPILEDTATRLDEWYSRETNDIQLQNPVVIPRRLGEHQFIINGIEEQRLVLPYSLWMMQRPLNLYHAFSSMEKKELEPFLKEINGLYAMRFDWRSKLSRIDNQFVII
jgi:glutathione S-transferase